jgi:hypothetical protein
MFLKSISWMGIFLAGTIVDLSTPNVFAESQSKTTSAGANITVAPSRAGASPAANGFQMLGDSVTSTLNQRAKTESPLRVRQCDEDDWRDFTSGPINFDSVTVNPSGGFTFQITTNPINVCVEVPLLQRGDIDPDLLDEDLPPLTVGTLR